MDKGALYKGIIEELGLADSPALKTKIEAMLDDVGLQLLADYNWFFLNKTYSIPVSSGTNPYALPEDFLFPIENSAQTIYGRVEIITPDKLGWFSPDPAFRTGWPKYLIFKDFKTVEVQPTEQPIDVTFTYQRTAALTDLDYDPTFGNMLANKVKARLIKVSRDNPNPEAVVLKSYYNKLYDDAVKVKASKLARSFGRGSAVMIPDQKSINVGLIARSYAWSGL